jgi:chemotaxis response regulator CheB
MTAAPEEKRRTPRITPFVAPCHVASGSRRMAAYLTDLSLEGARVACDSEPPAPEEWVTVEVRLPRQAERSRLPGRVKWVQPAENRKGHAFGITFEGMSAGGQAAVATVLAEFRRLAAELS